MHYLAALVLSTDNCTDARLSRARVSRCSNTGGQNISELSSDLSEDSSALGSSIFKELTTLNSHPRPGGPRRWIFNSCSWLDLWLAQLRWSSLKQMAWLLRSTAGGLDNFSAFSSFLGRKFVFVNKICQHAAQWWPSCYLAYRENKCSAVSPLSRGESTPCTIYAIRCRFARPLTSLFLKTKVQHFEPEFYRAPAGLCLIVFV